MYKDKDWEFRDDLTTPPHHRTTAPDPSLASPMSVLIFTTFTNMIYYTVLEVSCMPSGASENNMALIEIHVKQFLLNKYINNNCICLACLVIRSKPAFFTFL